jgi:prepilin-type N-terminal cleavage/methylation domain-containing protein
MVSNAYVFDRFRAATGDALPPRRAARGFSLLEVVVAVTLLVLVTGIATVSFFKAGESAKANTCYTNIGEIELQVQRWYRNHGSWPATDLRDIGSDRRYFPSGLPICPVHGDRYLLDRDTGRVVGHDH